MFKGKAEKIAELLEGVEMPPEGAIPSSAIKSFRKNRTQDQVAKEAGMSQPALNRLENGERSLTPETAMKLGPALGVSPTDLLAADMVSRLHSASLKGKLDPRTLLAAIEDLSWTLPDDQVGDDLVEALFGVLKRAIETYDAGSVSVATKSKKQPRGTRDGMGIQQKKRFDPRRY